MKIQITPKMVEINPRDNANYHQEKYLKNYFCVTTRSILRGKFYWKCQICYYKCIESATMKNHIHRKHKTKRVTFNV